MTNLEFKQLEETLATAIVTGKLYTKRGQALLQQYKDAEKRMKKQILIVDNGATRIATKEPENYIKHEESVQFNVFYIA